MSSGGQTRPPRGRRSASSRSDGSPISFVDLRDARSRPGELRRFVQTAGRRALLDVEGRGPTATAGLAYLRLDDAEIVARLLADANLLRLPLVRHGNEVTVGRDEATWTAWLRPGGGS